MAGAPAPRRAWYAWGASVALSVVLFVVVAAVGMRYATLDGDRGLTGWSLDSVLSVVPLLLAPTVQGAAFLFDQRWLAWLAAGLFTAHALLYGLSHGILFLMGPVPLAWLAAGLWTRGAAPAPATA